MNLASYNKLTKEEQNILLQAGKMTELQMPWIGDQMQAEEDAKLAKLGVKVTRIPADKIAKMRKAFSDGLWALGDKCCGRAAKEMRALAIKAGITPE